jgi:hypothetical protein
MFYNYSAFRRMAELLLNSELGREYQRAVMELLLNSELGREYQRAVMELFDGCHSRFLQGSRTATNNLSDASQSPVRGVSP